MKLQKYKELLDRYHTMIFNESWYDGRREELVKHMDDLWNSMSKRDQTLALDYARNLYNKRIHG